MASTAWDDIPTTEPPVELPEGAGPSELALALGRALADAVASAMEWRTPEGAEGPSTRRLAGGPILVDGVRVFASARFGRILHEGFGAPAGGAPCAYLDLWILSESAELWGRFDVAKIFQSGWRAPDRADMLDDCERDAVVVVDRALDAAREKPAFKLAAAVARSRREADELGAACSEAKASGGRLAL